jgi:hypothetical protein
VKEMMKSNVISPIQKIQLFQYNNKTNYEKWIYWVNYYIQWISCWLIFYYYKFGKYIWEHMGKWISKHTWIKIGFERIGYVVSGVDKKKMCPKSSNSMLEFIEIEYANWEEVVRKGGGNANMEVGYYEKESFGKIYREMVIESGETNMESEEEKKWKRRIMIVYVPMIGNVMMYYDIFRMSFAYYSDTKGIHYNILNACAMRYVGIFHCIDLFMDELVEIRGSSGEEEGGKGVIGKYWKSPIRWVNKVVEEFELKSETDLSAEKDGGHRGVYAGIGAAGVRGSSVKGSSSSGKGIQLDKAERDKLFAKLKQYRTEYVQESEIKLRNKFIYKGKTNDSYYHVFGKKVREVKVVAPSKIDIKKAFYSGILPIKLPKFWEVEEPRPVFSSSKEKVDMVAVADADMVAEEESSYVKYKREMENKKASGKI